MFLGSVVTATPGNYLIDTWRWDDDLPRDGIHSIAQGGDGYLWVASRYGLARFDGARFVSFSVPIGDVFAGHHYPNITADRFGTIWIGTPGAGLLRWRDRQIQRCVTPDSPVFGPLYGGLTNAEGRNLAMTLDGRVLGWSNGVSALVADASRWAEPVGSSICQDRSGNIWFVTYQHRLVRVHGTNAEEMVYGPGDERRNWIALQTDGEAELWAGTQRDVGVWRDDQYQPITPPMEPFPVDDVIAVPGREALWVVALGKIWFLEHGRWATNILFEPVTGLYETSPRMADHEGNLWFAGTKGGLSRANPDGSLLTITENDGLPPGRLAALYEDRESSIWVGIEHAGLARLRNRYFMPVGTREGTRAAPVWSLLEDRTGAIWLGTEGAGLHRWQDGKFTQFRVGVGDMAGSAYSICLDHQGSLWVGTGDNGVLRFENGKFVPVSDYPGPGWNKRVYVVFEDRDGRVWFGTGLGLFCWKDGALRRYNGKDFDMGVVRAIANGPDGKLWFGLSGGGVQRLACLQGEAVVARGAEQGVTGHDVFGLHADADGSFWICTIGDGLWRWHAGEYAHYSSAEGLPDARIYSIEEDGIGDLWLSSPAGIMRLSKATLARFDQHRTNRLECLLYERSDGLPTRECSGGAQPSIHRTRDGRLLFSMTDGAVALSPSRVEVNTLPPPVLIEEVRVDGKEREDGGVGMNIGPGRHVVEFRYTATSLAAPTKVRFRCRLDGVDNKWREAGASRSAMYNLTAPGTYRFRVAACNNDGVWNEAGAEAAVVVVPYVWQRLWFRIGAVGAALGIIGGSIRFVERRKLKRRLEQLEMQQMVERERARIARDIHDDLGASLTEMSLLGEFAQRESAPTEQVRADVRKIADKARTSTKALDEIVWAVNPRHDTLEGFVNYACSYAQEQLSLAGIRCRIEGPSPVPRRVLRADMRHHLFLAFKEAITNIVKHARASEAQMRITTDEDSVTVVIADNGCGFDCRGKNGGSGLGNGLVNMKERLEGVGGTVECKSSPGKGTEVKLAMKLA